jgi:hypothetical protein
MLDGTSWRRVALALDLSLGGMCVGHVGGLRRGQLLDAWVLLPDSFELECAAEVVRRSERHVGLRFLGLTDPNVRTLVKFLEQSEASRVRPSPRREGWGHG